MRRVISLRGGILLAPLLSLILLLATCGQPPPDAPAEEPQATRLVIEEATVTVPEEEAPAEEATAIIDAQAGAEDGAIIPETTEVLTPVLSDAYLTAIGDEGATMTFAEGVLQTADLERGDVLALEPTGLAPDGLLRRVVQVTQRDGRVELETVQATLEEAIDTGSAAAHITLTPADERTSFSGDGVTYISAPPAAAAGQFFLRINKRLPSGVQVRGEITLVPSFDFAVTFDKGRLKHLTLKNTSTQTGRLEMSSTNRLSPFDHKVPLTEKTFSPVPVKIGWFTIWLTPKLTIYVGVDGRLLPQLTTAVNQDVTFETGFVYDNGQVNLINNASGVAVRFDAPSFSSDAEARLYLRPQLDVLIFSRPGPYAAVDGYVKLEAGPGRTPLWELTGGVRGVVGVKAKILSKALFGYEAVLFDRSWPIAAAGSPRRVAFTSDRGGTSSIYLMNDDGSNLQRITNNPAGDEQPTWSPDGTQIAFTSYSLRSGWGQLHRIRPDGSGETAVTTGASHKWNPAWSPDGTVLAFMSDSGEIYTIRPDGSGQRNLTNDPAFDEHPSWSPNGARIVFQSNRAGPWRLYVMNADGSHQVPLLRSPGTHDDMEPAWSPGGNQIAFISNRDGNWEIYLVASNGSNPRRLTAHPAPDWAPSWSADGTEIWFASERDGNLEIYKMRADGTALTNMTNHPANDHFPAWQPAP